MNATTQYAPVVVFTYNRPAHTKRMIESLRTNPEFKISPVTIYCDAPKRAEHEDAVRETREVVRSMAPEGARIIERDSNLGLARSIISGVEEHVSRHGRAIIAEDDLVFTSGALGFLNSALDRYAEHDRVKHVSAYMYPIRKAVPDAFFYREATCWGWATWARAWAQFEPDAGKLVEQIDARRLRHDYNVDGSGYFYQMLVKQRNGELDSWAIRWYASIFLIGGLSLHPRRSFVENLGFDGTGVHCNIDDRFIVAPTKKPVRNWPSEVMESREAVSAMVDYRKNSMTRKRRTFRLVERALHRLLPF